MEWFALIVLVGLSILALLAATACDLTNTLKPKPFQPKPMPPKD